MHRADCPTRSLRSCRNEHNCCETGGATAAIYAQSIIPVIADSCGQSRTEPGLREKGKTHTQRAKLPKIRGSGTEPGNSIRTIADSRHLGTTPLHFQPAHTPPLTISSSPDSPMTRFPLLRSDQTLFRHPDAFEPAFVPDHLHHRDAQTQELARASSGPPSGAGALSPRLPGDREDHHRPPDLFRGHEETQSTSTAGTPSRSRESPGGASGNVARRESCTVTLEKAPFQGRRLHVMYALLRPLFWCRQGSGEEVRRVKCRSGEIIYVHHTE